MDFVHVAGVARANILTAKSEVNEGFFNVGKGESTTLKELLDLILELTKNDMKPVFKAAAVHGLANRRQADVTREREVLEFVAQTPLKRLATFYKMVLFGKYTI